MSALARFRDWWLGQFRKTSGLGKVAWVGVPLLFGCCALTMVSVLLSPGASPRVEPAAAATRAVDLEEDAVTAAATQESATEESAVETTAPTDTERPTATARATRTAAPTRTQRPTNTPRPTATDEPPTASRPPSTATVVRVATIPLPTATPLPPPPPTATLPPPPPTQPPPAANCDPSYPDVCIPSPPPDLNCKDIPFRRFRVLPPDPHGFDGNQDGVGCES